MKLFPAISLVIVLLTATALAQQAPPLALTRKQIKEAERLLSANGYWTGPIDGLFDRTSRAALIAFQKYEGRAITGKLMRDDLEAIRNASAPVARESGYAHVEVDVDRQLLMLVSDQRVLRVLPVSTGNDKEFETEGQTSVAYTPRGRFLLYEKEVGWGAGPLGAMYYSNFISGGVAIHGNPDVPTQPASHGCIRVPMFAARELSKLMPVGTIVLVYDKISFVSAKDWAENPNLKQSALLATINDAYDYYYATDKNQTKPRTAVSKKIGPRIARA
jgi:peptidoglycan hydrolase-like protein with peptidoglycan-binding domain